MARVRRERLGIEVDGEGIATMGQQLILKNDDISWTATTEGTIIVLDLRTSQYLNVNASATKLWDRLVVGDSVDGLVAELCTTFGISAQSAQGDVDNFVRALRAADLLVEQPA